ncbi:fimbria/pilus periplasmic chaperone [Klebsiella pneumoniae]|nr:fimbria/pilus periplasmic chaperone [Proteus mirabilis]
MDTGDASVAPDSVNVPFIITPLIFRIEPHTGQTLRIMYTGEALPNDRESIFWLRTYPNRILFQTMIPQTKCSIAS